MRVIFLTLALLVLAACGAPTSEDHLARAKEYLDIPDYPAATIELKNALLLDKGSAEARWLLGKSYLETGEILSAEKELRRAEELGWNPEDLSPALAKTLLSRGKVEEALALEHQGLTDPTAARLLSIQAMAALSDQQTDMASDLVVLAQGKEPQLPEVKLAEATVVARQGDTGHALALIEKIQEESPDDSGAQWLKGQVLLQQGELEAARDALDESIAQPQDTTLSDLIMRALVSVQLGDYASAQTDAQAVLRVAPANPTANYLVGVHYFQNREYLDAISALDLARPVSEQYPLMLYYLSSSHLIEKNLSVAAQFARQFHRQAPDDIKGRKLLTAILIQQDNPRQALDIVQPVLDQNPADVQALNFKANALLRDDRADMGMLLYARIVHLQPDWHIVPLPLMPTNEVDWADAPGSEGQQRAEPWLEGDGIYPQPDVLSILNYLARQDFEGAIDVARSYREQSQDQHPDALAPLNVMGKVYFAAGQTEEAREVFEEVLKRSPGNPSANWSLAEMAAAAGQPETARKYYRVVLNHRDDDLETLLKLAKLEAYQGNTQAMLSNLTQAARAHHGAFEPRLMLAEHHWLSGELEKMEPLFAELSPLQRRSPRVLELTALAQISRKEYDDALATLQRWIEETPESAQAHYLLALATNTTGDAVGSKQALLLAVDNDPAHVQALLALANLAHYEKDQQLFDQTLATLVELAPDAPAVLRLRALSAFQAGKELQAVELSQQAFEQAPTTKTLLELASLQKAAGQQQQAYDGLEQWIGEHPDDIDARLFLANSYILEDLNAKAGSQYIAILELNPDNLAALNNIAWIFRKDKPEKALAYIRRATDLAPDRPELLDTRAVIEFYSGDYASARDNIQRALSASPDNPSLRYHDAMIAAAMDDSEHAITTLEELVEGDGEFPERAEAQALLDKLKN